MISRSHGLRVYGFPPYLCSSYGSGTFLAPAVWQHWVSTRNRSAWICCGKREPGGNPARGHYSHRAVAPGAATVRGV